MKSHAKSKLELADILGISRQTLYNLAKTSDFPEREIKGFNVKKVQAWLLENTKNDSITAAVDSDFSRLKKAEIYERTRKLKLKNDREEKLVVSTDKLHSAFAEVNGAVKTILYQKLENEYPSLVSGLDIPGCRAKGAQLADSILNEFKKLGRIFK